MAHDVTLASLLQYLTKKRHLHLSCAAIDMIRLLICLAICLLGCSAQQEPEVTSEQNNLVLRTFNDNKAGFAQGESTVWFEDLATKQVRLHAAHFSSGV